MPQVSQSPKKRWSITSLIVFHWLTALLTCAWLIFLAFGINGLVSGGGLILPGSITLSNITAPSDNAPSCASATNPICTQPQETCGGGVNLGFPAIANQPANACSYDYFYPLGLLGDLIFYALAAWGLFAFLKRRRRRTRR